MLYKLRMEQLISDLEFARGEMARFEERLIFDNEEMSRQISAAGDGTS